MVQPQKESFQLNRRAEKNALKTLLKKNELGTLLPLGLLLIVVGFVNPAFFTLNNRCSLRFWIKGWLTNSGIYPISYDCGRMRRSP